MSKELENINALMQALTRLPEDEFEEAIFAVAILAVGTIKDRRGRKVAGGFAFGAIKDSDTPCLNWQGPAH